MIQMERGLKFANAELAQTADGTFRLIFRNEDGSERSVVVLGRAIGATSAESAPIQPTDIGALSVAVRAGGGMFRCLWPELGLVLFDNSFGSTLALPIDEVNAQNVAQAIESARSDWVRS